MGYLLRSFSDASAEVLTLHKAEVLRQVKRGLDRLQYVERLRTGKVTPLELEDELTYAWSLIPPHPSKNHQSPFMLQATAIAHPFSQEHLTALASLLADLTQHVPWRVYGARGTLKFGFSYGKWWDAVGQKPNN